MPRTVAKLVVAVAIVVVFAGRAAAQKVLYWSDKDFPRIQRMNADKSGGIQTLLTSANGLLDPRGVVLDPAAGKFYFADAADHKIRRANLDGSNLQDLVTTGQTQPADLAIDLANGLLYWTDTAQGTATGAIRRSDLSGNNVTTLRSGLVEPYFLTIDTPGGKIYWSDFDSGIIHRANLDGSGTAEDFITGLTRTRDMVIDPASGYLYWADRNSRKIQRRQLAGGTIEDLFDANDGLLRPHGLVLDTEAGFIYWTDTDAHAIGRGVLNGAGLPTYVVTGNDGQVGPWAITLAVPEPSGIAVLVLGAFGIAVRRHRSSRGPLQRTEFRGFASLR
jgi:low density lipoprotein receptor-related protein 5/6